MLFKINQNVNQNALKKINKVNKIEISENELEKLIISTKDDEKSNIEINYNYGVLSKNIFGEELFFISNQVATGKLNKSNSKYADIIAVDRQGNSVIIELKKHKAKMGVDMQALQYAVLFSAYKGKGFLEKIYRSKDTYNAMQDALMAFLNPNNDNITIEDINKKSRIILLASEFDDALLAMGEWLDTQGVAFKCIGYEIYKIEEQKYLSFSVLFDKSKDSLYRLRSNEIINTNREPAIFFHNIGTDWEAIHKKGMIPCGFDGQLNDRGTQIMRNYVEGDTIIAYQSRTGILGYGVITEPAKGNFDDSDDKNNHYEQKGGYRLYEKDSPIGSPHTLKIEWKYILSEKTAIKTGEFEEKFKIYHPIQTSSKIRLQDKAKELLELIEEKSEKIHM